jgi:proteasome lid subunit RPN8/RPN11
VSTIRTPASVLDAIVAHAREEAPNECCGLLTGTEAAIVGSMRARNALASPSRYRIDPQDHFAAIKRARRDGRRVIGAYHSHPRTPATPSERDIAEAGDPGLLCVIVSLMDPRRPEVRAYRISSGVVEEVMFLIPGDSP